MIKSDSVEKLNFINETSLAFIAFAAGAHLYVKELRSRYKSITWMTVGQLVVTFILSTILILLISDFIPFIKDIGFNLRFSVALLISTIFVASSPSSTIAVISEMRAKGPFTQTVMGVTVIKDVLVIVLFALTFSIAKTLLAGETFNTLFAVIIFSEIICSIFLGLVFGKLLAFLLSLKLNTTLKTIITLIIGYLIYLFSHETVS